MIVVPAVLALSLSAGGAAVVAKVDGVEITSDALSRRVQQVREEGKRASTSDVLESLVDEVVLAAEARRLGLAGTPAVAARIDAEKRRQAAELFLDRQVAQVVKTDDAQLRAVYHSTADYAWFDSATFEKADAASAALARAKGGATFADAMKGAAVASIYPNEASRPGTMRGQMDPALASAVFAAEPGAVIGPVGTSVGFTIARLVRTQVGSEQEFQQRRESLAAWSRKQAEQSMRQQYGKHLREISQVQIDEKFLASVGNGPPTAAQLDHVIATVGGRPVRYREVHETLRAMGAGSGHMASASIRAGVARREVEKRLVEDFAVQRGLDKAPEIAARMPEIERAALALAAIDHLRTSTPPATKKEIEAFYKRNVVAYGGASLDRVREDATARATEEKQIAAIGSRIEALRKNASISIDRTALAAAAP